VADEHPAPDFDRLCRLGNLRSAHRWLFSHCNKPANRRSLLQELATRLPVRGALAQEERDQIRNALRPEELDTAVEHLLGDGHLLSLPVGATQVVFPVCQKKAQLRGLRILVVSEGGPPANTCPTKKTFKDAVEDARWLASSLCDKEIASKIRKAKWWVGPRGTSEIDGASVGLAALVAFVSFGTGLEAPHDMAFSARILNGCLAPIGDVSEKLLALEEYAFLRHLVSCPLPGSVVDPTDGALQSQPFQQALTRSQSQRYRWERDVIPPEGLRVEGAVIDALKSIFSPDILHYLRPSSLATRCWKTSLGALDRVKKARYRKAEYLERPEVDGRLFEAMATSNTPGLRVALVQGVSGVGKSSAMTWLAEAIQESYPDDVLLYLWEFHRDSDLLASTLNNICGNPLSLMSFLRQCSDESHERHARIWLLLDGLNETPKLQDILRALDGLLDSPDCFSRVRVVASMQKGVIDLCERGAVRTSYGSALLKNRDRLVVFGHSEDGTPIPYLEIPRFTPDEVQAALSRSPEPIQLPEHLREAGRLPINLRLILEALRRGSAEDLREQDVVDSYLDTLETSIRGVREVFPRIGRAMLEAGRAHLPLATVARWREEAKKLGLEGVPHIDRLVEASILEPPSISTGAPLEELFYTSSHSLFAECMLYRHLAAEAPISMPKLGEIFKVQNECFRDLGNALERLLPALVRNSGSDAVCDLLEELNFEGYDCRRFLRTISANKIQEAIDSYWEAIRAFQRAAESNEFSGIIYSLVESLELLARELILLGKNYKAMKCLEETVLVLSDLFAAESGNVHYGVSLAGHSYMKGITLLRQGRKKESWENLMKAREILANLEKAHPGEANVQREQTDLETYIQRWWGTSQR